MANENKDVLRVEDPIATFSATIRQRQLGFVSDEHKLGFKATGGTDYFWTHDATDMERAGSLKLTKTTQQFEIEYDGTKQLDVAVDSAGDATFTATRHIEINPGTAGTGVFEVNTTNIDVDTIINANGLNNIFTVRGSDGIVGFGTLSAPTWKTGTYNVLALRTKAAIVTTGSENLELCTGSYFDITDSQWETTGGATAYRVVMDASTGFTLQGDGNNGSGAPGDALSWLELYSAKIIAAGQGRFIIGSDGASRVGIGTASPDVLVHIEEDTATTNAVQILLRIAESCSGTVVDGFGVGMQFELESSSQATMKIAGSLAVLWEDEDTGDADMVVSLQDNWSIAEVFRVTSKGELIQSNDAISWTANQVTAFGVLAGEFGELAPVSSTTGGISVRGYTNAAASAATGLDLRGYTENDPDDEGAVHVRAFKHDGAGALADIGAAGHVFAIENNATQIMTVHGNGDTELSRLAGGGDQTVRVDNNGLLSAGMAVHDYAGISVIDNASVTTIASSGKGNKVQFALFDTNDQSNGSTPDHTNDHITAAVTGEFYVTFFVSLAGSNGNKIGVSVFKNNGATEMAPVHSHRTISSGSAFGSISAGGLVSITIGDTLELWVWNETAGNDVTIEDATLQVLRYG